MTCVPRGPGNPLPDRRALGRHVLESGGRPARAGVGPLAEDAALDPFAQRLVDVLPVLEGAAEAGLGDAVERVADDVVPQPVTRRVVQALAPHGPRLPVVVVVPPQRV